MRSSTTLLVAIALLCTSVEAADISGQVYLKNMPRVDITVGYVGKDSVGQTIFCSAGFSAGAASSASAKCDTFQPRVTYVEWDSSTGCTFQHTELPAGTYVVYVKSGNSYLDWKRVRVKSAKSHLKVNLSVDRGVVGNVSFQFPASKAIYTLRMVPLDRKRRLPLDGVDIHNHLCAETDAQNGSAEMLGLRPGSYQVQLDKANRRYSRDGSWWASYETVGVYLIEVKAGASLTYKLPVKS